MMIQRFLKGINEPFTVEQARQILEVGGIASNWWRDVGTYRPPDVISQLTDARLMDHLNDYDRVGGTTPFISTTAGAVVRDARGATNHTFTADYIATVFATDNFMAMGWVFSGYAFTLGRKAVGHESFAEEVRDLHTYTSYLPFQPEGEVVAKIHIPSAQLECAWKLEPQEGAYPSRGQMLVNTSSYIEPAEIVNLREVL